VPAVSSMRRRGRLRPTLEYDLVAFAGSQQLVPLFFALPVNKAFRLVNAEFCIYSLLVGIKNLLREIPEIFIKTLWGFEKGRMTHPRINQDLGLRHGGTIGIS